MIFILSLPSNKLAEGGCPLNTRKDAKGKRGGGPSDFGVFGVYRGPSPWLSCVWGAVAVELPIDPGDFPLPPAFGGSGVAILRASARMPDGGRRWRPAARDATSGLWRRSQATPNRGRRDVGILPA